MIATQILSLVLRSIFSLSNSLSLTFLSHEIQFSTINSAPSTRNISWVELLRVGRAFLLIAVRKRYLIELVNILTAQGQSPIRITKEDIRTRVQSALTFGWSVKRKIVQSTKKRKKYQQKNNNRKNKREKSKVENIVGEIWRDLEKIITLWRGQHARIVEILPEKCHGGCEKKKFGKFERLKKRFLNRKERKCGKRVEISRKISGDNYVKNIRKMWKVAVAGELVSFTSF